jgi:hypothetical protein
VGEVVKAMGKSKVLVKVNPEGKYVVDIDKVRTIIYTHICRAPGEDQDLCTSSTLLSVVYVPSYGVGSILHYV